MVAAPVTRFLRRSQYGAAQIAKMSYYTAQYVAARHLAGPILRPGDAPYASSFSPASSDEVRTSFFGLLRREADDVAAGVYRMPRDLRHPPSPLSALQKARRYLKDTEAVSRRAHRRGGGVEVREAMSDEYPTYYRQNFHFQTDGWFSDESASLYDHQVEALFTGAAGAMRRRGLPFLLRELKGCRDSGKARPVIADVACGTAPLLQDLLDNDSEIDAFAVDLSRAYLDQAKKKLPKNVQLIEAAAEGLPFDDHSIDILFSVYLFHELPPKVRREAAKEFARVLRPGGLYLHIDTVQYGDTPMDMMVESFPRAVHEPYYDGYCREDLNALFAPAGLTPAGSDIGFLTKVSSFRTPQSAS